MIATLLRRSAPICGAMALGLSITGCGPFEAYRVRTEVRLDDSKLIERESSVDLLPVAMGAGFRAGGQASGEAVDRVKAEWSNISTDFDEALVEQSTPELRLVRGGTTARYVLQPEIVLAASSGDVWFGYTTDVGVLFTLWDRQTKRVVERFTVLGNVMGEWRVASSGGVVAHSVGSYLAARLRGKELNSNIEP